MGIVMALALAQRQAAVAPSPTVKQVSTTAGRNGTNGSQSAGLIAAPSAAPLLVPPAKATATVVEVLGELAVRIQWDSVDGAAGYQVTRFHKTKSHVVGTSLSTTYVDLLPKGGKPEHYTYEIATLNGDDVAGAPIPTAVSFG
jgi:hypothetical protein